MDKFSPNVEPERLEPDLEQDVYMAHAELEVIHSSANSILDIGTGFGFRNWHYITINVSLQPQASAEPVCLDTGCSLSIVDKTWLMLRAPDTKVRFMASPIIVRGIGADKHSTSEYAILDVYFPGKKGTKNVTACVTREVHLVDGLKAKMLIGVDIIGPESIDISVSKKEAYIGSCGVKAAIATRPRATSPVQKLVHSKNGLIIPARSSLPVEIQHVEIPEDRDFLFEPAPSSEISLYAHLVDARVAYVVARNDSERDIQLF